MLGLGGGLGGEPARGGREQAEDECEAVHAIDQEKVYSTPTDQSRSAASGHSRFDQLFDVSFAPM